MGAVAYGEICCVARVPLPRNCGRIWRNGGSCKSWLSLSTGANVGLASEARSRILPHLLLELLELLNSFSNPFPLETVRFLP
jgi:hypothetical protein